jgi:hypothetical protein
VKQHRQVLRCLIISPGDVADERDHVEKAITRWNEDEGRRVDVVIEVLRWERHAVPDSGAEPQQILDRQLVEDADFGIAVFWTRLGTPTTNFPSGSAEEIQLLTDAGRRVMVYVRTAVPPESVEPEQYERLRAYLDDHVGRQTLFRTFDESKDIEELVRDHLGSVVDELLPIQEARHAAELRQKRRKILLVAVLCLFAVVSAFGLRDRAVPEPDPTGGEHASSERANRVLKNPTQAIDNRLRS